MQLSRKDLLQCVQLREQPLRLRGAVTAGSGGEMGWGNLCIFLRDLLLDFAHFLLARF
jgi:hypothetical protein